MGKKLERYGELVAKTPKEGCHYRDGTAVNMKMKRRAYNKLRQESLILQLSRRFGCSRDGCCRYCGLRSWHDSQGLKFLDGDLNVQVRDCHFLLRRAWTVQYNTASSTCSCISWLCSSHASRDSSSSFNLLSTSKSRRRFSPSSLLGCRPSSALGLHRVQSHQKNWHEALRIHANKVKGCTGELTWKGEKVEVLRFRTLEAKYLQHKMAGTVVAIRGSDVLANLDSDIFKPSASSN